MRWLRSLQLLAKLERQELERERLELATLNARLAAVQAAREALRRRLPHELTAGWELPGGPAPLGRWLSAARVEERALQREAEDLSARRDSVARSLQARRAEVRRREIVAERQRLAALEAKAKREARNLDELAVLRQARLARSGSELRCQGDGETVKLCRDLDLAREA